MMILAAAGLMTACGTSNVTSQPVTAERGAALYGANCASCHGDAGQGTDRAPPVVGPEALPLEPRPGSKRDVRFRTALDVFNWVKVAMPGDDPGSLTDDEYLSIMAFDLGANGVTLDKPLDAEVAASIVLHAE